MNANEIAWKLVLHYDTLQKWESAISVADKELGRMQRRRDEV
jgi:hypothetical protein